MRFYPITQVTQSPLAGDSAPAKEATFSFSCLSKIFVRPDCLRGLCVTSVVMVVLLFLLSGCQHQKISAVQENELLQKACAYLWNQQSTDGGWHSETHGIMRGGESLSPFILHTLLQVPQNIYPASELQIERGLNFIRKHVNADGVIGLSDPDVVDYPNYATAHALLVLKQVKQSQDKALIRKMSQYLISQQFTEARGFTPDDAAYGGWGFGETNLTDRQTGHIDLSHTRRILQALRGCNGYKKIQKKARYYLSLTQKMPTDSRLHPTNTPHEKILFDGGFFASPITLSTNKGGIATDSILNSNYFRSYATATCDGILGLLASGFEIKDDEVQAAVDWLSKNSLWAFPQGIPLDDPDQWHEVLFYYHLAVRSEAYSKLNQSDLWSMKVYELLSCRQQGDGRFFNPMGGPNKEDDPLLATAFAVIALNNCR